MPELSAISILGCAPASSSSSAHAVCPFWHADNRVVLRTWAVAWEVERRPSISATKAVRPDEAAPVSAEEPSAAMAVQSA
eukprot:scaffold1147_cov68-Phaeocystis_antarctica.AAC.4